MLRKHGLWVLLLLSSAVFADPEQADSLIHHPPAYQFNGYLDGSYNYLVRSDIFKSGIHNRLFDIEENGLTFHQGTLTVTKQPKLGFGGVITATVGRDAIILAPAGYNADIFGIQHFGFVLPQAYVQYARKGYTFKLGLLRTFAGIESYNYTLNANFSRSILDGYAQPGAHTGLRLIKRVNHQFGYALGLANGWSTIKNTGQLNMLEAGIRFKPTPQSLMTIDIYTGNQHLTDITTVGPTSTRTLIDLYGSYLVNPKLSLFTNIDYAFQKKAALPYHTIGRANWSGLALYATYLLEEKWKTSLRGEMFADTDGYRTGVPQNWRELTLSLMYRPIKSLQIRAETRHDFSNVNAFYDRNRVQTNNNNQSYALDVLYEFS